MKERKKKLLDIVRGMTLQEKALQLTQYTVYSLFKDGEEQVVTGNTVLGGMTADMLWKTGSVLNGLNGETVQRVRQMRRAKGIDDPVIVMLDVIHGYKTIFPVPLAVSCSFDTVLAERCAKMSAEEAKYDGTDVTFSPMADLCRDARWGRVMESFGEDPYLVGEMAKAFIRGYHKGGLGVCVKHFAAYGACEGGRDYDTVELSERTLKEYYLLAYKECLQENPEMFMCAFNALGGLPMIANRTLLYDTLRSEWGFDGVLISDYGAVAELIRHGYVATEKECAIVAAKNGLDIEMCSPSYALHLPDLVRDGVFSESEIDESVYRVVALKDKLGLYENPDRFTDSVKREEVTLCDRHRELARVAAEESFVLLKNDGGMLPLSRKVRDVVVMGPNATSVPTGGGAGFVHPFSTVSVAEGMQLVGKRLRTKVLDPASQDEAARKRLVAAADAVIYCAGFTSKTEGENFDRTFALPEGQAEEIAAAAALNPNLIVVVNSGGGVDFSQFGDRARAILMAWYPGQEGGRAIAEILTGAVSPSGKLPISIERRAEENPTYGNYYENVPRSHRKNATQSRVCYNEGVFVGYRGYDRSEVEPLYPFGFGLSYTTFAYSGLKIARLEDGSYAVSFDVKNTGRCDGAEVAQLYVSDLTCSVPRPVKELKGYEKVFLKRGAAQRVEMRLPREAFAFYDMERHDFVVEPGDFLLQVGASSRDLRLKGTLHVD